MKVHDVTQGTPEWLQIRSGIPTASEFSKIITPTGKKSSQATDLLHSLIAERLMGRPRVGHVSWDMERGSLLEEDARSYYELQRGIDVEQVGFITNDAGTIGCSPDGLVSKDGLVEIKCPAEHTHVGYLLSGRLDRKYMPQIQGQLWVTERKWVDILSYHPEMPEALIRVERDEEYIAKLAEAVMEFSDLLEETWAKVREQYVKDEGPAPMERPPGHLSIEETLWLQREDAEVAL